MNDERMQSVLEDWLMARDAAPEDVRRSARQVMKRKARVRQRSRWWPVPVLYRRAKTPTRSDTTEYQPSPIPASTGHTTTVIGRTQTMFSPVKAITAGALVFALAGAFLIAQPFEQRGTVPGAQTEAIAPMWVTGDIQPAPSCSSSDVEVDGDVRRSRNEECNPQTWTSSDPRLTGEVSRRWNEDTYRTDERSISVGTQAAYLRNDNGGWACSNRYLAESSGTYAESLSGLTFTCIGGGGYEGLSALLVVSESAEVYSEEFVGVIFSGDLPPLPEAPAAE